MRDLLAERGRAAPLERAVRADHGRRVPGHEPAPAGPAGGARAREPVRGRRRVPVDLPLPPRRRADLPRAPRAAGGRRACAAWRPTSARTPELLDVLNAAFAPVLGERLPPLVAGRDRAPSDGRAAPVRSRPAGRASRPSSCSSPTRAAGRSARPQIGLAALAEQPWRRAEARLVAHRLREEVDAGRRPGDVVVLVRATASLRLFEQALEDQGLPTYVVGGRGYWSQEQVRDGTRLPRRARQPARRVRVLRRPRLAVLRRLQRRAGPARRRRPREPPRAVGRAAQAETGGADWLAGPRPRPTASGSLAFARLLRRRARAGRAARRSRRCSSARSRARATTSRSSPARAGSGGWRTCAS